MGKIIENYSLQEVLGEGVYGKVYKAINLINKQIVAVKVIKADKFKQIPKLEEFTVKEINILSNMEDNQHIVKYIDMLKTLNNFYFVYEYCNGGTLQKQIKSYKNTPDKLMPQNKVVRYFKEIVEAFKSLTKNNIMHRDLKPDNILLHNGIIKLADFGFCKLLNSPQDLAQTMLGSPIYMAPEVLKGQQYTMKADIWSLGVVLYQMLFGECPFQSNSIAKLIQILQKEDLVLPKVINPSIQKLLRRMLVKDRFKRIDWNEIYQYKLDIIEPSFSPILKNFSSYSGSTKYGVSFTSNSSENGSGYNNSNTLSVQQNIIKKKSPMKFESPQNSSYSDFKRKQINNTDLNLINHRKVMEITRLSLDTLKKNIKQSIIVSYLLCNFIQKQLFDINESLKNEVEKQYNNKQYETKQKEFKIMIEKQIENIQIHTKIHKQEIQKYLDPSLFNNLNQNKNKFLKNYIQALRIEESPNIQNLVHAQQILDYFEEGILLKKDAYQRLTKQQLIKQIQNKLMKLI